MAERILSGGSFINRDGGLIAAIVEPTTESLLIIGSALDGPVDQPQAVRGIAEAEALFGPLVYKGDYKNPKSGTADNKLAGNTLIKAMHEAILGGAGNIQLVRVGGTTASGIINSLLEVHGFWPGRIYNGITATPASGASNTWTLAITQPSAKGSDLSYSFNRTDTLAEVVAAVNTDSLNRSVKLKVSASNATVMVSALGATGITLAGGTNGTTAPSEDYETSKNGIYSKLIASDGTFEALSEVISDVVYMAALYGDDQVSDSAATTTTVAQKFAEFIYKVSRDTYPTHGVIGLRPTGRSSPVENATYCNANYLSTAAGYVDSVARHIKFGYFMNLGFSYEDDRTGESIDVGRLLSVIAGPDVVLQHRDLGIYADNGAAVYAGLITTLQAKSATTRKPLGSVRSLAGIFSKSLHENLVKGVNRDIGARRLGGGAYVTFRDLPDIGRPAVSEDVTAALRGSDYERLQILRITHLAHHLVRRSIFPFLGEGLDISAKMAIRNEVKRQLDKMVEHGALFGGEGLGYQFDINTETQNQEIGEITINLQLRPAIQLRFITVNVSVTR